MDFLRRAISALCERGNAAANLTRPSRHDGSNGSMLIGASGDNKKGGGGGGRNDNDGSGRGRTIIMPREDVRALVDSRMTATVLRRAG